MELKFEKAEPDQLDKNCTTISDALRTMSLTVFEKRELLLQVIDYLDMEIADDEAKKE